MSSCLPSKARNNINSMNTKPLHSSSKLGHRRILARYREYERASRVFTSDQSAHASNQVVSRWGQRTIGEQRLARRRDKTTKRKPPRAIEEGERLSRGRVSGERAPTRRLGWTDQQYECLIEAPNRLLARQVYK